MDFREQMSDWAKICHEDSEITIACHPQMRCAIARALLLANLPVPVFADKDDVYHEAIALVAKSKGYSDAVGDMTSMADLIDATLAYVQKPDVVETLRHPQRVTCLKELALRLRSRAKAAMLVGNKL